MDTIPEYYSIMFCEFQAIFMNWEITVITVAFYFFSSSVQCIIHKKQLIIFSGCAIIKIMQIYGYCCLKGMVNYGKFTFHQSY